MREIGIGFGMALASRANLFPLAILLPAASFLGIADLKLKSKHDLRRILIWVVGFLVIAGVVSLVTFRLTQPMSFRARSGDTGIFTFSPNPDWLDSMGVAQNESRGIGGGPPSEQWANRPAILFPLINMVVWGMGLPLGIAAWTGLAWAAWKTLRNADAWRIHLLPLLWVGGYFFFMSTRFVKSMRYFLPIYPFLCLFAGWSLYEFWRRRHGDPERSGTPSQKKHPVNLTQHFQTIVAAFLAGIVVSGTFIWASAFVRAVYLEDHTRIRASRWIYEHVPPGSVISNESWDEGLPLPVDGYNPYGGMYEGVVLEVRWYDSEEKRSMFLNSLDQADYIILPSQRSIWSISRIPMTYPMTMEYYRALFDGRLGFDLVAVFTSPIEVGPLKISDVGGAIAWNVMPELPLFNDNLPAAEEAFSVYDHPPVWVFKKRDDFDAGSIRAFFYAIDLSQVVIQSPTEATKRINN